MSYSIRYDKYNKSLAYQNLKLIVFCNVSKKQIMVKTCAIEKSLNFVRRDLARNLIHVEKI